MHAQNLASPAGISSSSIVVSLPTTTVCPSPAPNKNSGLSVWIDSRPEHTHFLQSFLSCYCTSWKRNTKHGPWHRMLLCGYEHSIIKFTFQAFHKTNIHNKAEHNSMFQGSWYLLQDHMGAHPYSWAAGAFLLADLACLPSWKPLRNLRYTNFKWRMRPVPVVFLLFALTLQLTRSRATFCYNQPYQNQVGGGSLCRLLNIFDRLLSNTPIVFSCSQPIPSKN